MMMMRTNLLEPKLEGEYCNSLWSNLSTYQNAPSSIFTFFMFLEFLAMISRIFGFVVICFQHFKSFLWRRSSLANNCLICVKFDESYKILQSSSASFRASKIPFWNFINAFCEMFDFQFLLYYHGYFPNSKDLRKSDQFQKSHPSYLFPIYYFANFWSLNVCLSRDFMLFLLIWDKGR